MTGRFVAWILSYGAQGFPADPDSLVPLLIKVHEVLYLISPDGKRLLWELFPGLTTPGKISSSSTSSVDVFEYHDERGRLSWRGEIVRNPLFQSGCRRVWGGSTAGDDHSEQCAESE